MLYNRQKGKCRVHTCGYGNDAGELAIGAEECKGVRIGGVAVQNVACVI